MTTVIDCPEKDGKQGLSRVAEGDPIISVKTVIPCSFPNRCKALGLDPVDIKTDFQAIAVNLGYNPNKLTKEQQEHVQREFNSQKEGSA